MAQRNETGIRETIDALMHAGRHGDLDGLDRIYHRDMKILMLDDEGNLNHFDKPGFMALMADTVRGTNPDDHKWARFNAVEATGDHGHVLITRKVPIGGGRRILELSIDLIFEDDRWQVSREVIFARPQPEPFEQSLAS